MSQTDTLLRQLSVQGHQVAIRFGDTQFQLHATQIDNLIKLLEASKFLVNLDATPNTAPDATVQAEAPSPVAPPPAPVELAPPVSPPKPKATASPTEKPRRRGRKAGKGRRRSRKPIGDSLVSWMESNPGWQTTETLLAAVIENEMTDANPRRALMIALGRKRDEVFKTDGQDRWRLIQEPAANAPTPSPARRNPKAPQAQAKAPAASADSESESPASTETTDTTGQVLRVKRGQRRSEVLGQNKAASSTPADILNRRWGSATPAERERIRRNFFGD